MSKPIAIIAGDIHYSLATLKLADTGTRMAIALANELNVPFISNGDLHDSKANLRGECVNALIETFKLCKIKPYINVGNHSRINERSHEHSINFLAPYGHIIEVPTFIPELNSYIIPYDHDAGNLMAYLKTVPKGSRIIAHQGVVGGTLGDYIQDRSAIPKDCLADFRTILSHYHARQDIKCGRPQKGAVGLASYIGNLYSLTYGEANDLPKGYAILMDDGTLEFVPTNLRKHVIVAVHADGVNILLKNYCDRNVLNDDLLWIKVSGTYEDLAKINRGVIKTIIGRDIFKLDLIPLETVSQVSTSKNLTSVELFDNLIDNLTNTSDARKIRLKELYKHLGS